MVMAPYRLRITAAGEISCAWHWNGGFRAQSRHLAGHLEARDSWTPSPAQLGAVRISWAFSESPRRQMAIGSSALLMGSVARTVEGELGLRSAFNAEE